MSASTTYVPRQVLPSAVGGASSTAEFIFQDASSNAIVLTLDDTTRIVEANSRPTAVIRVTAAGRVTGGTTTNFTAQLLYGTSTTAASNTDIETTGAIAANSESENWLITALFTIDTTSNKLNGYGGGWVGSTIVAWAATAQITSVDLDGAAGTELGFTISGTFSASDAGNAAYLDTFFLELLG